jgi:hypothetical protein
MKRFLDLYEADKSSTDAHRLGLKYVGFGRWADSTGKIAYKTVDNGKPSERLEKIEDTEEEEPADTDRSKEDKSLDVSNKEDKESKKQKIVDTIVSGTAEKAKRDPDRKWRAGPDGDTMAERAYLTFRQFISEGEGNPTPGGPQQTPDQKAKQMGLQSDGHGGYIDANGQLVARTVNGELVFLDAKGGVTDDSSTSAEKQLPSHTDPNSGIVIIPPHKPETEEDEANIEQPTPFKPPLGYDEFIKKFKRQKEEQQVNIQPDMSGSAM